MEAVKPSKSVSCRKDLPVRVGGRNVAGIDIGKKSHAAAGVKATGEDVGPVISFDNDRAGVDRLEKLVLGPLGGPKKVLVAMEATGHYWMPLYFELARRGYEAVVLNPIQTRGKFRTRIRKTKTDKLDARSIAHFVLSGDALAARIPDEKTFELRLLTRRRRRLMDITCDLERFSGSLVDRLFPEYAGTFSKPWLPTGRALVREVGLVPGDVLERADEVAEVIRRAGRGRVHPDKVRSLVERARDSIGIGRAEEVMTEQLRSTLDLVEYLESQIEPLDDELARRVGEIDPPLPSLGLRAPIVATIHATPGSPLREPDATRPSPTRSRISEDPGSMPPSPASTRRASRPGSSQAPAPASASGGRPTFAGHTTWRPCASTAVTPTSIAATGGHERSGTRTGTPS
jgi:transposase